MIPVVTPDEMSAIDRAAAEPVEVLIERAGAAVARTALDMLGGTYGRRVAVVAGKGNNGADGRAAARRLERRGVRVAVFDAAGAPPVLPPVDLLIDAAYGTGFRGSYVAPDPGDALVLAVDIPSGVSGLTGEACAGAAFADATVTFAALKPGLLLGDGPDHAGVVVVADIGLDAGGARCHLVEPSDLVLVPRRAREAHKYSTAVLAVAGSPGMTGAAALVARGALRAGAGYCRLAVPGGGDSGVTEVVSVALPGEGWARDALDACDRMRAAAIGPGLGRGDGTVEAAREFVRECPVPLVVDADGLFALGDDPARWTGARAAPAVLTPHEGEFRRLGGDLDADDRIAAVRSLASASGAAVLLKRPLTIVAAPDGRVLLSNTGGARLATAGTGDVLTGVIAAFAAAGLGLPEAAALAACAHGLAARRGRAVGLVAGDLPDLVSEVMSA